jgi:hypothetical protein
MYDPATGLSINSIIYDGTSNDCTLVPDGWYSTQASYLGKNSVFKVESGVITDRRDCSITTTTTTTPVPTTTTTTTISPTCNEYEVAGPTAIFYTDCFGNTQELIVASGNSATICASVAPLGGTLIGPCTP